MIVYKTASQTGVNDIYDGMSEYIDEHEQTDAHKIIDTDLVDDLKGVAIEVSVDRWGNKHLHLFGRKFTITQFFHKYRY